MDFCQTSKGNKKTNKLKTNSKDEVLTSKGPVLFQLVSLIALETV